METNNPLISVIVPVYNVEKYLPRCIESILAQTFTDFELLLIDDGSNDKSGEICEEYAKIDNRIKVFHKENGGVSSARNVGLDNAKGELITFVDSDDWIDKESLNNYLKYDADLICQGFKQISSIDNSIEELKNIDFCKAYDADRIGDILFVLFIGGFLGYTWNKLFRRKILIDNNIRFMENISIREDEIFIFLYCHYIKSLVALPTMHYNYVHYKKSLMRREYINPIELVDAINLSYEISLKLHITSKFKNAIDIYHTDSLVWAGRMLYYNKHLLNYSIRIPILKEIYRSHKLVPTESSKIFCKQPLIMIDFIRIVKYYIKCIYYLF